MHLVEERSSDDRPVEWLYRRRAGAFSSVGSQFTGAPTPGVFRRPAGLAGFPWHPIRRRRRAAEVARTHGCLSRVRRGGGRVPFPGAIVTSAGAAPAPCSPMSAAMSVQVRSWRAGCFGALETSAADPRIPDSQSGRRAADQRLDRRRPACGSLGLSCGSTRRTAIRSYTNFNCKRNTCVGTMMAILPTIRTARWARHVVVRFQAIRLVSAGRLPVHAVLARRTAHRAAGSGHGGLLVEQRESDAAGFNPSKNSVMVDYSPSEFSRIRVQFAQDSARRRHRRPRSSSSTR